MQGTPPDTASPGANPSPPDRARVDELHRRIGRNLLLLQQVEAMLKSIVPHARLSGPARSIARIRDKQRTEAASTTLGPLVQRFADDFMVTGEPESGAPAAPADPWISFSHTIEVTAEFREAQSAALKQMVEERNELVHHFLARLPPFTDDKLERALEFLDAQRDRVSSIRETLAPMLENLHLIARNVGEFFASGQGERLLELRWIQSSPLVQRLAQIAERHGGPEGWVALGTAGRLLRESAHYEMNALKVRYGHAKLKDLVVAADVFEVRDAATTGGGVRTEYRIKADGPP